MPWLKVSDNAHMNPIVYRAYTYSQTYPGLLNELFGFAGRCASFAASFRSDYLIEESAAIMLSDGRADRLIPAAFHCGYFTEELEENGKKTYRIVEDPELFHMRLRSEMEWENQRRNDTRNKDITIPVRLRDGDACRWCGKVVNWNDHKGGRGGTYDHLKPGEPAETINDMVVCCRSCNSARKDNKDLGGLLPAPKKPFFSHSTAMYLAGQGYPVRPSPESEKPMPKKLAPEVGSVSDAAASAADSMRLEASASLNAPGGADSEALAPEVGSVSDAAASAADSMRLEASASLNAPGGADSEALAPEVGIWKLSDEEKEKGLALFASDLGEGEEESPKSALAVSAPPPCTNALPSRRRRRGGKRRK